MATVTSDENAESRQELGRLTAGIVSAYVANNPVPAAGLPTLITSVNEALSVASSEATREPKEDLRPAVPIKRSVTDDAVRCLFCGKAFKALKRHLRSEHDVSPEQYREKWGLKHNYPMTAPGYTKARSEMAKRLGLGRKRR